MLRLSHLKIVMLSLNVNFDCLLDPQHLLVLESSRECSLASFELPRFFNFILHYYAWPLTYTKGVHLAYWHLEVPILKVVRYLMESGARQGILS